jgi:UDP-N-acetylmuramoyl-tripeptide--D-alanyl-D-alanine ligase
VLVLELGIDRPGDMEYLMRLVTPDVGVLTNIGISHLENFGSQEKLAKEKRRLVAAVPKDGYVLLNADNDLARESAHATKANVMTYGFRAGSDIVASDLAPSHKLNRDDAEEVELSQNGFPLASSFKVQYKGNTVPFTARRVLGRHQVSPLLPAIGCGLIMGMNLVEISSALSAYIPPRGRMNLIPGIKGSLIIDDTYNSAPDSAIGALEMLRDLTVKGQKVTILGDMLELGTKTEEQHRAVGAKAVGIVNELITFGPRSQFTSDEAQRLGLPKNKVHHVAEDHRKIEQLLQNSIRPGDVVLIKGSQGMRMEKVVLMLMARPEKAKKLLVRQSSKWLKKPFVLPDIE